MQDLAFTGFPNGRVSSGPTSYSLDLEPHRYAPHLRVDRLKTRIQNGGTQDTDPTSKWKGIPRRFDTC